MSVARPYDLIVLGGGMAGLPVSIKGARSGLKTALIEDGYLGGTCLNRGCIQTKTMIRSAKVANLIDRANEFGITREGGPETEMEAVVERKQRILEGIREGAYRNIENTENLDLVRGHGVFESPTELAVDDSVFSADQIVVNTGARPRKPPTRGSTKCRR